MNPLRAVTIPLIVLLAVMAVFGTINPAFLGAGNLSNVFAQSVYLVILAAGLSFVLVSGGIDLSVGAVLGVCAGVTGFLLLSGLPIILAIAGGVGVGLVVGLANWLFIEKAGLNDFIATIAMLWIAAGALRVMDANLTLRGFDSDAFATLARGQLGVVPVAVIIAAVVVVALEFLLQRTVFGRFCFLIGTNRGAAQVAGIPIGWVRLGCFGLAGGAAGLSGVMLASRLGSVQSGLGIGFELEAIAAAVIGGTRLMGGRGSVIGSALGAVTLLTINNGLQMIGAASAWFRVITGGVILLAMLVHRYGHQVKPLVPRLVAHVGIRRSRAGDVAEGEASVHGEGGVGVSGQAEDTERSREIEMLQKPGKGSR